MDRFFDQIRAIDFGWLYSMYFWGIENYKVHFFYVFFAKYGIVLMFLCFIYLIWSKRINALICSFFAVGIAAIIDVVIYIFWKRPRPYIAHADDIINNYPEKFQVDVASFPSSHTYIAFAIAVSILLYGHKKLGIFLLIIAFAVALSRIGAGLHYPSDVIGGAMLGTASGILSYILVHKWEKFWYEPSQNGIKRYQK